METLTTLLNNPVILALLIVVVIALIGIIKKGKISAIGKDGITFRDNNDLDIRNELKALNAKIDAQEQYTKDVQKALLRLQIISDATSLKTKLELFDEYKKLGGNSYIDLYIEQQKQKEVPNGKSNGSN